MAIQVYPMYENAIRHRRGESLDDHATALLRLAPTLLAQGAAVAARDALPLYVRDKVAQTTDERERLRVNAAATP